MKTNNNNLAFFGSGFDKILFIFISIKKLYLLIIKLKKANINYFLI